MRPPVNNLIKERRDSPTTCSHFMVSQTDGRAWRPRRRCTSVCWDQGLDKDSWSFCSFCRRAVLMNVLCLNVVFHVFACGAKVAASALASTTATAMAACPSTPNINKLRVCRSLSTTHSPGGEGSERSAWCCVCKDKLYKHPTTLLYR